MAVVVDKDRTRVRARARVRVKVRESVGRVSVRVSMVQIARGSNGSWTNVL